MIRPVALLSALILAAASPAVADAVPALELQGEMTQGALAALLEQQQRAPLAISTPRNRLGAQEILTM